MVLPFATDPIGTVVFRHDLPYLIGRSIGEMAFTARQCLSSPKSAMLKLVVTTLASCILMATACSPTEPESPPNIVVILADDFGVGDIQVHYPENKIPTPHLDRLVREGKSFTDAHSASAVCTPTRYGLLTGRYAWRTPLQEWVLAAYEAPLIRPDRLTLAEYLGDRGYHTALVGKWHLGVDWEGPAEKRWIEQRNGLKDSTWNFAEPFRGGPVDHGFDYYYGVNLPNQPPFTYLEQDTAVGLPTAIYRYDSTEGVVMPRHFDGTPMAPDFRFVEILPKITQRAVNYLEAPERHQQPFFLFFSQTSPHEPVVPTKRFAGKSGIAPIADFVMDTDWSAGEILEALDRSGLADNTIVIFTADNGHSHYTGWEQLIAAGHLPSGPYRGHKGDIWEGGHRVPFIVRWPGRVMAGTQSNSLLCLNDIFATCADLLDDDPLPADAAEDSFSFLAALGETQDLPARTDLVSHSVNGEFAYRSGPWKLVYRLPERSLSSSRAQPAVAELYHLRTDQSERENVADTEPGRVRQLKQRLAEVVASGGSREEISSRNDVVVTFDTVQPRRWGRPRLVKPDTD